MAKESKELYEELDAAELLDDSGLLFEFNRLVLHPIGYHIGAPVVDGKRTLRVIDYKHVEGGLAYGPHEWREAKEKLKAFNKKREVVRRVSARVRIFGCIIQETNSFGSHSSRSKDPGKRRTSTPRGR